MDFSRAMETLQRPQIKVEEIFYYKAQKTKMEKNGLLKEREGWTSAQSGTVWIVCGLKYRFI